LKIAALTKYITTQKYSYKYLYKLITKIMYIFLKQKIVNKILCGKYMRLKLRRNKFLIITKDKKISQLPKYILMITKIFKINKKFLYQ